MTPIQVLLIDDDQSSRKDIVNYLQQTGNKFEVIEYEQGDKALNHLKLKRCSGPNYLAKKRTEAMTTGGQKKRPEGVSFSLRD